MRVGDKLQNHELIRLHAERLSVTGNHRCGSPLVARAIVLTGSGNRLMPYREITAHVGWQENSERDERWTMRILTVLALRGLKVQGRTLGVLRIVEK